jgi:hypothetical protein
VDPTLLIKKKISEPLIQECEKMRSQIKEYLGERQF